MQNANEKGGGQSSAPIERKTRTREAAVNLLLPSNAERERETAVQ